MQKAKQQLLVLRSLLGRCLPRAKKSLTRLEMLTAGPPYLCPFSQQPISELQAHALIHVMNIEDFAILFTTPLEIFDLDQAVKVASFVVTPAAVEEDLLNSLEEFPCGRIVAAVCKGISPMRALKGLAEYSDNATLFSLFLPLVRQLRKLVRYNDLRDVMNFYSQWFNARTQHIEPEKALSFINEFNDCMRHLNGRVIEAVPSYDFKHVPKYRRLYRRLLVSQARSYSLNLEYEHLESMLAVAYIGKAAIWLKICDILGEKPARSERNIIKRHELRQKAAEEALNLLDREYQGKINQIANRMLCYAALEEEGEVAVTVQKFLSMFPGGDLANKKGYKKCYLLAARLPAARLIFRAKPLYGVFYMLVKSRELELAQRWLNFAAPLLRKKVYEAGRFAVMHASTAYKAVCDDMDCRQQLPASKAAKSLYAQCLRAQGRFDEAVKILEASYKTIKGRHIENLAKEASKLIFLDKTSKFINGVAQPKNPAGVVLVTALNCYNSLAIVAPSLVELKKQGYAVIHLTAGMLNNIPTGVDSIDKFAGSVSTALHDGKVLLDWKVDWENRIVECQGINFYQGIYERLSISYRRFSIDVRDPLFNLTFKQVIRTCDYLLRSCLMIRENLVEKGIPVIMLSGNTHVMPCSTFRDFCFAQNNPHLRFVAINVAYENYYNNLSKKFSGSMSVVDMTKHRTCRMPFLALPERFENWYAANKNDPLVTGKAQELIYTNRSLTTEKRISPVTQRIQAARAEGRKVICCFGKIPCDLAVPYDGGPAHRDMGDWVNHTIEVLAGQSDVLLLIKPHPHELRPEIALDLVDRLRDIVPQNLPENIIFLDHSEYNLSDMAFFLDLAILWNGTSSLELTAMNVPVMMCSYFGRYDYSVPLIYPESRDQYRDYLCAGRFERPTEELKNRAMALLHYMGTTDVALPNLYTKRAVTNDYTGFPVWDDNLVSSFMKDGDPFMRIAANRIIEGIETDGIKRRQHVQQ